MPARSPFALLRLPVAALIGGLTVAAAIGFGVKVPPQAQTIEANVAAFANADLAAPPAPGSFAISDDAPRREEHSIVAAQDCVTRLREAMSTIRLQFSENGTHITAAQTTMLRQVGEHIKTCEDAYVVVAGHADGFGPDATNMAISWARADNALNQLVAFGVDPAAVEAVGYGATTPLSQGSDAEDPADRRVEFHVFRLHTSTQ